MLVLKHLYHNFRHTKKESCLWNFSFKFYIMAVISISIKVDRCDLYKKESIVNSL